MSYDPTEHTIGHGKQLHYAAVQAMTSPTKIEGTIEISTPESELGAAEHTNDDSPDFHKEYGPGMYEPGTVSFTYKYARTEFAKLEALKLLATVAATRASAIKWWRITLPDGSTSIGKGFVTKNGTNPEQEDGTEAECEIQCTGKWEFTPYVAP